METRMEDLISQAELELLKRLASDMSKQEIADVMGKSLNTINHQQKNLMAKTGTHCRTGAVMHGLKRKLIAA